MLSNTLENYLSKYSQNIEHRDFYLYWLENDILLELNDNKAIINSIQPNLQRAFPNKSYDEILDELIENTSENQIISSIQRLWDFLPNEGRTNMLKGKHLYNNTPMNYCIV